MTCICVSKTGLVVTGSGDKTLKYWNFPNLNDNDHERALNLTKTLTGKYYLYPFSSQLFNFYFPFSDHQYSVNSVCLSPGGTLLCSASTDGTSRLWDARTGSELAILIQPSGAAVRTSAFCPGESVLASAGDDEVSVVLSLFTLLHHLMCGH